MCVSQQSTAQHPRFFLVAFFLVSPLLFSFSHLPGLRVLGGWEAGLSCGCGWVGGMGLGRMGMKGRGGGVMAYILL